MPNTLIINEIKTFLTPRPVLFNTSPAVAKSIAELDTSPSKDVSASIIQRFFYAYPLWWTVQERSRARFSFGRSIHLVQSATLMLDTICGRSLTSKEGALYA
jgi:hypothetical protein